MGLLLRLGARSGERLGLGEGRAPQNMGGVPLATALSFSYDTSRACWLKSTRFSPGVGERRFLVIGGLLSVKLSPSATGIFTTLVPRTAIWGRRASGERPSDGVPFPATGLEMASSAVAFAAGRRLLSLVSLSCDPVRGFGLTRRGLCERALCSPGVDAKEEAARLSSPAPSP